MSKADYKKRNRNALPRLFIAAMILLLVAKNSFRLPVPELAFTLVIFVFFFTVNEQRRFVGFCFMIPLSVGLPLREIALLYILALLFKDKRSMETYVFVLVLVLIILEFVGNAIYSQKGFTGIVYDTLSIGIVLILICFFSNMRLRKMDVENACLMLCFGAILGFTLAFITSVGSSSLEAVISGKVRFGNVSRYYTTTMRVSYNPNQVGLYSSVGVAMCMLLWQNKRIGSLSVLFMIIAFLFYGFLTLSRGFLLGISIDIICLLLFGGKTKSVSTWKKIGLVVTLAACVALVLHFLPDSLMVSLNKRLASNSVDDFSNGRTDILAEEIATLFTKPYALFFGASNASYRYVFGNMSAHNMMMDIWLSWGFVGISILFAITKHFFKRHLSRRPPIFYYLPFFVLFVVLQTGQFITNYGYFLTFFICIFAATSGIHDERIFVKGTNEQYFQKNNY